MPADGLPIVLERGTIEIEVLFLSDVLRITTGTCIKEGSRLGQITKRTGSRWAAGDWREPIRRQ
jgi:hypothetical protein